MRLGRVLLPPDAEVLSTYCKQVNDVMIMFDDDRAGDEDDDHHYCHRQGFDDTLRFLQKRYMISCTRCLAVASTYEIEDEMDEEEWEVIMMILLVIIMMIIPGAKWGLQGVRPELPRVQVAEAHRQPEHCAREYLGGDYQ